MQVSGDASGGQTRISLPSVRRVPSAVWLFAVLLAVGWFGVYQMGFIHADALARSANAFHVIFSRDPHLAAMGLFWPPLPSFVQIPLMPLVRPFGSQGIVLAGVAVSAAFAAGFALLVHRFLVLLRVPRRWRLALLIVGLANPLLVYYMVSRATELPFLFFVIGATYFLIDAHGSSVSRLAVPGVFLAGAVLTRYEGLATALVISLAAAFVVSSDGVDTWSARSRGY